MDAPLEEYTSDTKHIIECFNLVVEEGNTVIDYGCGIGRFTEFLKTKFKNYVGVDIVRKLPQNETFVAAGDFLKSKISADAIFTCVVLQHITDDKYLDTLFEKFSSILPRGGCVYMNEQVGDGTIIFRGEFPYINRRKRGTYINMLNKYGFILEREIPRREHKVLKFKKVI